MTETERFEAILDTLASDGWKFILEDIEPLMKAVDNIDDVSTVEELWKRKGELERLRWFASMKEWYQYSQELYEAND